MKQQQSRDDSYQPLMNRRSFIFAGLSLATLGSSHLIASEGNKYNFQQNSDQLIEKLLSVISDRKSAIQVGKAVLNEPAFTLQFPDLVIFIMNNLGISCDTLNSIKRVDLMTLLNNRTVLDFDSGNLVNVAGWMLGQTEAQLCVLAAQTQSSSSLPNAL